MTAKRPKRAAASPIQPIVPDSDSGDVYPPWQPRLRSRRARLNVNLTSLIDVTFLLLVYFMVATSMGGGDEEIYRMDLPDRGGPAAGPADPFTLDDEPLRITIASLHGDADDALPYSLRIEGPWPQPESFEHLHEILRDRQINQTNAGGTGGTGGVLEPDHPIIVQPAGNALWAHAIEAFNAAARARYTNITFAKPQ